MAKVFSLEGKKFIGCGGNNCSKIQLKHVEHGALDQKFFVDASELTEFFNMLIPGTRFLFKKLFQGTELNESTIKRDPSDVCDECRMKISDAVPAFV